MPSMSLGQPILYRCWCYRRYINGKIAWQLMYKLHFTCISLTIENQSAAHYYPHYFPRLTPLWDIILTFSLDSPICYICTCYFFLGKLLLKYLLSVISFLLLSVRSTTMYVSPTYNRNTISDTTFTPSLIPVYTYRRAKVILRTFIIHTGAISGM